MSLVAVASPLFPITSKFQSFALRSTASFVPIVIAPESDFPTVTLAKSLCTPVRDEVDTSNVEAVCPIPIVILAEFGLNVTVFVPFEPEFMAAKPGTPPSALRVRLTPALLLGFVLIVTAPAFEMEPVPPFKSTVVPAVPSKPRVHVSDEKLIPLVLIISEVVLMLAEPSVETKATAELSAVKIALRSVKSLDPPVFVKTTESAVMAASRVMVSASTVKAPRPVPTPLNEASPFVATSISKRLLPPVMVPEKVTSSASSPPLFTT